MKTTDAATPGPDEKLCPFCAEVIRAAAIKCRYCHSDLPIEAAADDAAPDVDAVPDVDVDDEPGYDADAVAEDAPEADPAPIASSDPGRRLITILLVVCLALGGGIAALVLTARPDDLRTASNAQVTSTSYRSAAMGAAAANAATLLSYGYMTLEADEKAARDVITPAFAKEYDAVMKEAGPKALAAKLTLKATVVATSLISLREGTAKVMLFVNAVTTAEGSTKQQLNQNRVLMSMTRKDGDWVVSKMDAF